MRMRASGHALISPGRRRLLRALGAGIIAARWSATWGEEGSDNEAAARSKHFPFGPVVPARPIPPLPVVTASETATDLATVLRGHVSAVQLMFTGCSATCPIQGALFSQAQRKLGSALTDAQFVSISIDPLADTPAALAAWLRMFDAQPAWLALRPRVEDLDRLFQLLGEGGEPRPRGNDPHTGQVYVISRRGELVLRTPSLPPVSQIVDGMHMVASLP